MGDVLPQSQVSQPYPPKHAYDDTVPSPYLQADAILYPCLFGWSIQLILAGATTTQAINLLSSRSITIQKTGRTMLTAAVLANIATTAVNFAELAQYLTDQDRSSAKLNGYNLADAVSSLSIALPIAITQSFFASKYFSW